MEACIKIEINPQVEVPASALLEALRTLHEFGVSCASEDVPGEAHTAHALGEYYEGSIVLLGFTPDEEADIMEVIGPKDRVPNPIWGEVEAGDRPVGEWRSGFSMGCHQYLMMKPDGSFYWTEP